MKSQYGFRSNHSTGDAAIEFNHYLIDQIEQNHIPIAIFLDLSKAFDTIDHNILLNKLHHYGIRNNEFRWFKSYLSDRNQYVLFEGTKSRKQNIKSGVPQGSILGPLLFLIYINDLDCASDLLKLVLFADDSTLNTYLCFNKRHSACLDRLTKEVIINKELGKISDWLDVNKLSLNISKTKYMIFHAWQLKINPESLPSLKFYNKQISLVSEFNFLGILFDKHLQWNKHIDCLMIKLSRTLGILNHLKSYIPKSCLKILYNSLFHSHLNYGILLWGHKIDRIVPLQKKALRIISLSHFLSHTDPLFKNENILKVYDIFKLKCISLYYRFKNNLLPLNIRSFFRESYTPIHSYPTSDSRRCQNKLLQEHNSRTELAKNCIQNTLPKLINSISSDITSKVSTHSLIGVKCLDQ